MLHNALFISTNYLYVIYERFWINRSYVESVPVRQNKKIKWYGMSSQKFPDTQSVEFPVLCEHYEYLRASQVRVFDSTYGAVYLMICKILYYPCTTRYWSYWQWWDTRMLIFQIYVLQYVTSPFTSWYLHI